MIDFTDAPDDSPGFDPGLPLEKRVDLYDQQTPLEQLPKFLRDLNGPQREAALHVQGPLIVLAGAGSGKTKMLTSRVAYLVGHCRVPAYQVMAVTFTNKAAGEMRERVERAISQTVREAMEQGINPGAYGSLVGQPEIGTFHAICVRILRREWDKTGFSRPFVIFDDSDQLSLIKTVMKKLDIDAKSFNPKAIQGSINRAKCDAIEPQDVEPGQFSTFEKKFKQVYLEYQKQLINNNALDFGEIITMTYRLLRDHEEVRKRYQRRYRYLHVDEYQDTNRAQYLLLSQLASPAHGGHGNVCVVGDEDQSIYGWRGADIRNILDFEKEYPQAHLVKLEQNYRSSKCIIGAASHVISHNSQRKDKILWTSNEEGPRVQHRQYEDEKAEAESVIGEIKRLARAEGRTFDEFAILYRTHAQSRQFEDVLRREKIAYQVVGGLRFYDRKEIKDVMAYFRLIQNPSDSVSLKRILNVPIRGIGKTTIDRLDEIVHRQQAAGDEGANHWRLMEEIAQGAGHFSPAPSKKLKSFVDMIQGLQKRQPTLRLSEFYHILLDEIGMVRKFRAEESVEADARIENLEEFDTILQEFEEDAVKDVPEADKEAKLDELRPLLLGRFLEQSTLTSNSDQGFDPSSVRLMTLHGCKGLEFPVVFMVGMEEGLFPSFRPWEETPEEEIEEERRLCYVGMTRAEKMLFLTHASMRRIWGNIHYHDPARFIGEIPFDLIESRSRSVIQASSSSGKPAFVSSRNEKQEQEHDYSSDDVDFVQEAPDYDLSEEVSDLRSDAGLLGRAIKHPEYGRGKILSLEGFGEGQKVTIRFSGNLTKKFIFKYVASYLE